LRTAHAHAYTHARTHARIHIHACTHTRMHPHTHAPTHTCTHTRMHPHTHLKHLRRASAYSPPPLPHPRGLQTHLPEIYARFPEHKAEIDAYLREAKAAVDSIPMYALSRLLPWWLQRLLAPLLLRTFRKYAAEVCDAHACTQLWRPRFLLPLFPPCVCECNLCRRRVLMCRLCAVVCANVCLCVCLMGASVCLRVPACSCGRACVWLASNAQRVCPCVRACAPACVCVCAPRAQTSQAALQRIVPSSARLRALLSSLWIDTGAPPTRCCFFMGAAVFYGFPQRGGAYPVGGSQALSAALVPVIERAGGRVLVRADVQEVVFTDAGGGAGGGRLRATGVRLVDGTLLSAPLVVSSAG
jgi:hypothetical protein